MANIDIELVPLAEALAEWLEVDGRSTAIRHPAEAPVVVMPPLVQ